MNTTREYFSENNYHNTMSKLKFPHLDFVEFLAKCNVEIAQTRLGWLIGQGFLEYKNYTKAIYLYKKAIDQGSATACLNLGWLYWSGKGVKQSDEQTIYYWKLAAKRGCKSAINCLRVYYNITI